MSADYVVLDMKRPWFLIDIGCQWIFGQCTDRNIAEEFLAWSEIARQTMTLIFEEDGFLILKRI